LLNTRAAKQLRLTRPPAGWLDRQTRKLAPILVAVALLAGCTIPKPPGNAPLR
jgi:hypothetical protein